MNRFGLKQSFEAAERGASSGKLESQNPLFHAEVKASQRSSKMATTEMGGNYGGPQDGDEDEDDVVDVGGASCFGDRTCTRAGWCIFCRRLQCPCARPRHMKKVNPGNMVSIALRVPVARAMRYSRPDNVVVTSKYTPWDFFPRATALQFRRAVNVYYLYQVTLLIIGWFFPQFFESPFTPFGTMGVLMFVIGVTLITEAKDDAARHRADAKTNNTPAVVIQPESGKKKKTTWGELVPGDLVLLKNRDLVPADVLIVQSSQANGFCYIETSGIDGETNLKIRRSPTELKKHVDANAGGLAHKAMDGVITYEEPNPFLNFSGSFQPSHGAQAVPLGFDNVILRGSELRNTNWIIAMVLYAGHETKLVMSKRNTPSKFATMDYLINRIIFWTILQQTIMTAVCDAILFLGVQDTTNIWYFSYTNILNIFDFPGPLAFWFTFTIIFANVVPIDLYVVIEVATGIQSWLLVQDKEMYDPVTNTPAGSKTTNLISEIGQVSHVFSDKTGTLTQNVMRLVGCSLGGRRFGVKVPDAGIKKGDLGHADDEETMLGKRNLNIREVFGDLVSELGRGNAAAREFLLLLSVCHTVVMDVDEEGKPRYNAEGPDEEALVKASAALGSVLESTEDNTYVVDDGSGEKRTFKVLGINAFSSDRKRMSVVVRDVNTGACSLMLKGADSIVAELTATKSAPAKLQADLDAFAQAGLRTLLVARKSLTSAEADAWAVKHNEAKNLIGKAKQDALDAVALEVEQNLEIIGATAIEDALQEGVPETIKMLRDAGIKVWVLTGDKVDTAINIGFSSKLLDPDMHQILLDGSDTAQLEAQLDEYLTVLNGAARETGVSEGQDWESKALALVVTGKAVENLLVRQKGTAESQTKLLGVANNCSVVLACRVSPAQKALIVKAATQSARRRGAKPIVSLAIGDGANDVAMIQEARVGVGISGKEGLQAVNSADFSIAQFKFLQRLLFVHGHWSYQRNSNLLLYVCFTWQALNWPLFFYLFVSMFSGEQVYVQTFYITIFAWIIHYLPLLASFFDRDLRPETLLKFPEAYDLGRLNEMIGLGKIMFGMFLRSLIHAAIFYAIVFTTFPATLDMGTLGTSMYMALMATVQLRIIMVMLSWVWPIFFGLFAWCFFYPAAVSIIDIVFGDGPIINNSAVPYAFWAALLVAGALTLLEYTVFYGVRRTAFPTRYEVLVEIDRGYGADDATNKPSVMRGPKDISSAITEGVENIVYVPRSAISAAFRKRKRVTDVESGGDVVVRADEDDVGGPGGKFGKHRSGYDFAGPSGNRD